MATIYFAAHFVWLLFEGSDYSKKYMYETEAVEVCILSGGLLLSISLPYELGEAAAEWGGGLFHYHTSGGGAAVYFTTIRAGGGLTAIYFTTISLVPRPSFNPYGHGNEATLPVEWGAHCCRSHYHI